MKRRYSLVCATALIATGALVTSATAAPAVDTAPLREAVTVEGIMDHMAELEAIANANVSTACPLGRPARQATRPLSATWSTRWKRQAST